MTHAPLPDPAEIRPRKLWFWVGGLVIFLGIAGGITGFVLGIVGVLGSTSTDAEFDAGEKATFQATEANTDSETWKVYADQDVPSSDVERNCEVTGPSGQVGVTDPGFDSESTVDGETWILVSQLDITEPGEYTIECARETDARFSVGHGPHAASNALGVVGSIASLILGPLLGIVVGVTAIVVTGVRRGRHRRRLQAHNAASAGVYGPGPSGYGGQFPGTPPGWQ